MEENYTQDQKEKIKKIMDKVAEGSYIVGTHKTIGAILDKNVLYVENVLKEIKEITNNLETPKLKEIKKCLEKIAKGEGGGKIEF